MINAKEHFIIPQNVNFIINKLLNSGFKTYLCGGAVRDLLLGNTPKDYDICTSAFPEQVKKVFSDNKIIETGLKHGTITVIYDNDPFEITTLRIDGKYSDGRHPDEVIYTNNLIKDLSRRDFTINAMAIDSEGILHDPFNGTEDIKNKILKCVGIPDRRFSEDALRMLRAIRISRKTGFIIDYPTWNSIKKSAHLIMGVSNERIRDEFNQIIMFDDGIKLLVNSELMKYIYPEFLELFKVDQNNPFHIYNVGDHTLKAVEESEKILEVRIALFLHDFGKRITKSTDEDGIDHFYKHPYYSAREAERFLSLYKYDNIFKDTVKNLVEYHDVSFDPTKKSVKKLLNKLGKDTLLMLISTRMGDIQAQNKKYFLERFEKIKTFREIMIEVLEKEECFTLKDLSINGYDVMNLGFQQGEQIGKILNHVLEKVINEELDNEKSILVEYVHNLLDESY